jgi:cell division protein FtsB
MAKKSEKLGRKWLRRLAWGGGGALVLYLAVEGGEYGTSDLWTQREQRQALETELEQLRDSVTQLRTVMEAVTTDTVLLERMAREQWGMVRGNKEILYWVRDPSAPADSAVVPPAKSASDSANRG